MDHEQINQFDLIDRYLMGKLPSEESASFEEHFVDCPQCVAQLQITKSFMRDFRSVAAGQASQIEHRQPGKATWHFPQTLFRKPLALAIGCLLIAAAAGAVFVVEYTRRLRGEVSQAESLTKLWEDRYEEERQSAISADRRYQEAVSQRAEQLRALEAKLKDEEAQRARIAAEFSRRTLPEGNLSMFILNSVRGLEPNASESDNQVILPRSSAIFALSISLEGEPEFKNYLITIYDDRHRLVWKRGATPNSHNFLSVTLRSDIFRPGPYSLTVEGVKKEGGRDMVGNYPFLVKTPESAR
jgi:hypothetical protein